MDKAPDAFRTISEVAEWLDTPAHVLRFWESRFPQVKPVKRAGGRRYYRPDDMALLGGIKHLLHSDGLSIRGVQKVLQEKGARHVAALCPIPLAGAAVDDADGHATIDAAAVTAPEGTALPPGQDSTGHDGRAGGAGDAEAVVPLHPAQEQATGSLGDADPDQETDAADAQKGEAEDTARPARSWEGGDTADLDAAAAKEVATPDAATRDGAASETATPPVPDEAETDALEDSATEDAAGHGATQGDMADTGAVTEEGTGADTPAEVADASDAEGTGPAHDAADEADARPGDLPAPEEPAAAQPEFAFDPPQEPAAPPRDARRDGPQQRDAGSGDMDPPPHEADDGDDAAPVGHMVAARLRRGASVAPEDMASARALAMMLSALRNRMADAARGGRG